MNLLICLALLAAGDVYFEQATVVQAKGRAPGPGVVTRVYYAGRKMRLETGEPGSGPAFVLRLDQERAFRLDPEQKLAVEVDARGLKARAHTDLSMAADLMGLAEARPKTAPLKSAHLVAGYRCPGYRITAGQTIMDLYVSSELPVGVDTFVDFLEWTGAGQSLGPLLEEIRGLPGIPLETRSRITVLGEAQETRSTVTRVKVGALDDRLFEVPAGYRVVQEEPLPAAKE
jgi:hypothetical protein